MTDNETIEVNGKHYQFLEDLKELEEKIDGRECAVRPCVEMDATPDTNGRVPAFTVEFVRGENDAWVPVGIGPMIIRHPETNEELVLDWGEHEQGYFVH